MKNELPTQLGIAGPDPRDDRDRIYMGAPPEVKAVMPSIEQGYRVSDKTGELPNFDQWDTWGCGAFGALNDFSYLVLAALGIVKIFSKRDLYSRCVIPGGKGTYIRDIYKTLHQKGVCEDRFLPTYKPDGSLTEEWLKDRSDATPEAVANALENRIDEYLSIPSNDFELLLQAIFESDSVGCGMKGINAIGGHFFNLDGFGIHNGLPGLKRKDSVPILIDGKKVYDRWIVKVGDKYYLENAFGSEVVLYSHWLAKKDFSKLMDINEDEAKRLCDIILHRPDDPEFMKYAGKRLLFVLNEIEKAPEHKRQEIIIKIARFLKLV